MNRPCFQSHRRKTQYSSMFYCIHESAISPTEKRNLGDLDKIFSSPYPVSYLFDTSSDVPPDLWQRTVLNMMLMLPLLTLEQLAKQLAPDFHP